MHIYSLMIQLLTSRISTRRFVSTSTRPSCAWTLSRTSAFLLSMSSSLARKAARADFVISSSRSSFIRGLPMWLIIPEFFTLSICVSSSCCFSVVIAQKDNMGWGLRFNCSFGNSLLLFLIWNDASLFFFPCFGDALL